MLLGILMMNGMVGPPIGYQSTALDGAPFDDRRHVVPNTGGVVLDSAQVQKCCCFKKKHILQQRGAHSSTTTAVDRRTPVLRRMGQARADGRHFVYNERRVRDGRVGVNSNWPWQGVGSHLVTGISLCLCLDCRGRSQKSPLDTTKIGHGRLVGIPQGTTPRM